MGETDGRVIGFVGQPGPVGGVLGEMLSSHGMRMRGFACLEECRGFFAEERCDLLLIDLDGEAAHGSDLLTELDQLLPGVPKIALVDHGDIPTAIQAIRAGAANCLEKPVDAQELCSEIQGLLDQGTTEPPQAILTLTRMEKTVLHLVLEAKTNSEIARVLHRSPRTIEVHRSHVMHKLDVSNPVELMKTAAAMGLLSQAGPDQCTSDGPFTLGITE